MFMTVVLIVDDNKEFADGLKQKLGERDLSLTLETAYTGEEAIARIQKKPNVDVVIIDMEMTCMDGIEAMQKIKTLRPLTEVIAVADTGTFEKGIECMKQGAFDCMEKSFDLDTLLRNILDANDQKNVHERKIVEAKAKHIGLRRGSD